MIKILHLSHTDILYDSRILKEMRAAEAADYHVLGVGIQLNESTKESEFFDKSKIISIPLFAKKMTFLPRSVRHLLTFIEFLFKSFVKSVKFKPNIIHCNDTLVLPIGVFLNFFLGAKVIYDAHELESDKNGLSFALSKLTLWVEKVLWRFVDGLVVVSPSIERWYHDNLGKKHSVIVLNSPVFGKDSCCDESIDLDYLRTFFEIPEDRKIFIYVGILDKGRGIDLLLNAFKNGQVRSHLVFLGYGQMYDHLKLESGKYINIHVHDAVPHDKVVPLVRSADVGLCLIENVSLSDYYCLPNKLFEYCFAGLPVIASNFPDIRTVVSQYKLGAVTDLDTKSLLAVIARFEQNEGRACFTMEDLEPLQWETQASNLLSFYGNVSSNKF